MLSAPRAALITRWYVSVRLDADARFSGAAAAAAFSGAEALEVEAWQAMFAAADHEVLRLFEGVRGVACARVRGSVAPAYARWLEIRMMSAPGDVLGECPLEAGGGYGLWVDGNR